MFPLSIAIRKQCKTCKPITRGLHVLYNAPRRSITQKPVKPWCANCLAWAQANRGHPFIILWSEAAVKTTCRKLAPHKEIFLFSFTFPSEC